VLVCVCLSVCLKSLVWTSPSILCLLPVLWPWIGSALAALRIGKAKRHILKVTQQGAAWIWHSDIYSNWPTRGSTGLGTKSDVYNCLIVKMWQNKFFYVCQCNSATWPRAIRTCWGEYSKEPIIWALHFTDMTWTRYTRQFRINYFATAGLNNIVFTIFLSPNPGHLVPCILDNVGTILCYQTSNVILINATLLLVHFFIMSKFYVFVLCVRVCIVW